MNIHILGAASGIGKWFAEQAFAPPHQIFAYDINPAVTELFASKHHILPVVISLEDETLASRSIVFEPGDVLLLAVPEQSLAPLCQKLKPFVPADLLVGVMTSRQAAPVALVTKALPDARVFGMHPLFGPHVSSPHGQSVVFCSQAQDAQQWNDQLAQHLIAAGIRVIYKTPEAHDRDMGYVQALTHFVFLAFSHYLKSSEQSVEDLMLMRTPPFQFLLAFSSRMLMQSPATLATIQTSEAHQAIREGFLKTVQTLNEVFSGGDTDAAEKTIAKLGKSFSLSSLEDWMHYSEVAVSTLQEREAFFHERCAQKAPVVFKAKGASEYRVGLIEAVETSGLQLTEFTTRMKAEGAELLVPCPTSEIAALAYKKQGVHIKKQPLHIKKENIEVLSDAQATLWLYQHVLPVNLTHTFDNPMRFSGDFISSWVVKLFKDVQHCQCLSTYENSVTLVFVMLPEVSVDEVLAAVQIFLRGEPAPAMENLKYLP